MPISQSDMTLEQRRAVVVALAEAMETGQPHGPIVPGTLRCSRSGQNWVSFDMSGPPGMIAWHRWMDIPARPTGAYQGAECVIDDKGRPLGNDKGPLVLHQIRGQWIAQTIRTGWNRGSEILWATPDAASANPSYIDLPLTPAETGDIGILIQAHLPYGSQVEIEVFDWEQEAPETWKGHDIIDDIDVSDRHNPVLTMRSGAKFKLAITRVA